LSDSIPRQRLYSQLLAGNALDTPHNVVSHFGAVQAQDYLGALWAIGLRTCSPSEADVERAVAERRIVRCWPMRGTLHFVAAEDVRWMLELLAPRVLPRRVRLERHWGLDRAVLARGRKAVERELRDGRALTRAELYAVLDKARVTTAGGRGLHAVFALAQERVICFGRRSGKQPTFVLFDEWLPPSSPKTREEALAELARRYFTSHGPAGVADFVWWSGLTVRDAKEAVALANVEEPERLPVPKRSVHLLPPFDEYTVAYKDRSAILDPAFTKRLNAGGGMLNAVLVIDGRVGGTWKRTIRGEEVTVDVSPFRPLTAGQSRDVKREIARYTHFLSMRAQ